MNSKTCIDQWLYYHLKKKTFSGLVWGNKQLQFQITWEKHGTKGYEKTFEICKAYRERNGPAEPIKPSLMKSNLNDAIKKSSNVRLVQREQSLQEKNFLLCQFKKLPAEHYFGSQQEGSKTLSRGAESMDVNEYDSMPISSEENNGIIFRMQGSASMDLEGPMNYVDHITERPEYAENLDKYSISLTYDGKKVAEVDVLDLSKKCRFHYGDRESQIKTVNRAIAEADSPSKKERYNDTLKDLLVPSIQFPGYEGDQEKTKEYLNKSIYGIVLCSQKGFITAKRLCQNRIYVISHSVSHAETFEELVRGEEKVIFSLKDYLQGVRSKKYNPNDEIRFVYGKKPKMGVPFHVCLFIKSRIIQQILNLESPTSVESSCNSSENSLDREFRLLKVLEEIEAEMGW